MIFDSRNSKNDIKIALKPTGIKLQANNIKNLLCGKYLMCHYSRVNFLLDLVNK